MSNGWLVSPSATSVKPVPAAVNPLKSMECTFSPEVASTPRGVVRAAGHDGAAGVLELPRQRVGRLGDDGGVLRTLGQVGDLVDPHARAGVGGVALAGGAAQRDVVDAERPRGRAATDLEGHLALVGGHGRVEALTQLLRRRGQRRGSARSRCRTGPRPGPRPPAPGRPGRPTPPGCTRTSRPPSGRCRSARRSRPTGWPCRPARWRTAGRRPRSSSRCRSTTSRRWSVVEGAVDDQLDASASSETLSTQKVHGVALPPTWKATWPCSVEVGASKRLPPAPARPATAANSPRSRCRTAPPPGRRRPAPGRPGHPTPPGCRRTSPPPPVRCRSARRSRPTGWPCRPARSHTADRRPTLIVTLPVDHQPPLRPSSNVPLTTSSPPSAALAVWSAMTPVAASASAAVPANSDRRSHRRGDSSLGRPYLETGP